MTLEEKAKAYDEAIEKAKDMLSYGEMRREDVEHLFPSLIESEEDRIRVAITRFLLKNGKYAIEMYGCTIKEATTWLEKQGEKPITIGKCKLTGKAAELAKEVTPESLEEAKEKLNAEEKLNQHLNEEIQDWYENSEHMDSLWCTVKDAIELTARHFFELGLKAKEDKQ